MLSGCFGTRHLSDGEKRIYHQQIDAPKHINNGVLKEQLTQQANKTILPFVPTSLTIGFYYFGNMFYKPEKYEARKTKVAEKYDKRIARTDNDRRINTLEYKKQQMLDRLEAKIQNGNTLMQWGEPVVVFDSTQLGPSAQRIETYLFSKGYFDASVSTSTEQASWHKKMVNITYSVETGIPYYFDSIIYFTQNDLRIDSLLNASEPMSYIHRGDVYDEEKLSRERERIDLLLKDNGYYNFSRQYVEFNLDTSSLSGRRIIFMANIRPPDRGVMHPIYRVDSIRFTADANVIRPGDERMNEVYNNILFRYFTDDYSPKILSPRVAVRPGTLYSRSRTLQTQQQLAKLEAFKFVNINYDTSGGYFITNIFTSPLSRYEWSNEAGVNVTEGYPGPFYNLNLKRRNLFGGLENLDFNGRIGFEGVSSALQTENIYRSIEAGVNTSLTLQKFLFPLNRAAQARFGNYNPRTRIQVGYAYTNRPEYTRSNASGSFTYLWETRRTTELFLTLTNINVISTPFKTAQFDSLLLDQEQRGNLSLSRSFNPSFVSSMIFGIGWNNNYRNSETNSSYIRAQIESGGTSLNFLSTDPITDRGLEYFQYLRFSFDFRRNIILNRTTTLAWRVNTGMAYPYSDNKTLPYEKFFFAGGSRSIRAWRPRRLGWGSLPPSVSEDIKEDGYFDYSFERPGEILLEGSIELRKDLFGFVEGAAFIDAGNVWLFRELQRPEGITYGTTQFRINEFYKQLGIGTGFGLGFDFTFLILRFDVGIKVYDPARPPGERFVLDDLKFFKPFGQGKEPVIYNIGIGYPF